MCTCRCSVKRANLQPPGRLPLSGSEVLHGLVSVSSGTGLGPTGNFRVHHVLLPLQPCLTQSWTAGQMVDSSGAARLLQTGPASAAGSAGGRLGGCVAEGGLSDGPGRKSRWCVCGCAQAAGLLFVRTAVQERQRSAPAVRAQLGVNGRRPGRRAEPPGVLYLGCRSVRRPLIGSG